MPLILLCFSLLPFITPPHDISMAIFAISIEQNTIQLKVQIDRADIEKALNIPIEQINTDRIAQYVADNTTWSLDNTPLGFTFISINKDEEHYLLETAPLSIKTDAHNLKLQNTCLLEEIADQTNIIYFKQNKKELRGFNMNKDRTEILIDLAN